MMERLIEVRAPLAGDVPRQRDGAMNRKHEPAIWPFVLTLAVAFVFTLAQGRSWAPPHNASYAMAAGVVHASGDERAHARLSIHALPRTLATGRLLVTVDPAIGRDGDSGSRRPKAVVELTRVPEATDSMAPSVPPKDELSPSETPLSVETALLAKSDGEYSAGPESGASSTGNAKGPPAEQIAALAKREEPVKTASRPTTSARKRIYAQPRRVAKAPVHHAAGLWGEPTALLDQLDSLANDCETGLWAAQVGDVVRELCRQEDWQSPRTLLALKQLRDLVAANHPLLALPPGSPHAGPLRRMRYAVLRRIDLWELVPELADARRRNGGRSQTVSLSNEPRFEPELPTNITRLLAHLECFEQTGLTDDGREIVADVSRLSGRDEKLAARTHRWLEWNYRNANLRLVCSQELMNRLLPVQPAVEEPVHDRILGVPTRGWSTSTARLSIHLVPDPQTVRFTLEAKGIVLARTASRRDPVTVYSNSDSAYLARKQVQLSASGLQTWPTEAEVSNNSRLRGIETDYDDIPLVGVLVESIARAKHAESEPAVRRVARRKVASRVQEEIDAAIEPKLTKARQQYRERVVSPLEGLSLEPSVIEMQTTEARLTSRLRLAGDEQLAACTPRPMALAGSLASIQMHQSVANNICDRLDLDGHTFTLPGLQQRLVTAFRLPPEALAEEYPSDLRITFAKRDALIARFDDGRIELTLNVAELQKHPKTWRDFQVRVYYRPQVNGLDVRFLRDGTVQLRGEHFGREPQIVLRGIFSKVFSHDRELVFFDAAMLADPRLAGLSVTQCVLTEGWIGLSIGVSSTTNQAMRCVGPLY